MKPNTDTANSIIAGGELLKIDLKCVLMYIAAYTSALDS